jgi:hypothetical protein
LSEWAECPVCLVTQWAINPFDIYQGAIIFDGANVSDNATLTIGIDHAIPGIDLVYFYFLIQFEHFVFSLWTRTTPAMC